MCTDSDEWNYRPSKRARAAVPPRGSGGDPDGNSSSPGTSQPDVSMTDQTDDYQDEVLRLYMIFDYVSFNFIGVWFHSISSANRKFVNLG